MTNVEELYDILLKAKHARSPDAYDVIKENTYIGMVGMDREQMDKKFMRKIKELLTE